MNILIIQGPNLNLLGLRSAQLGSTLTLDKVNKLIRRHVRNSEHTVKIVQTHKTDHALSLLQRNRNWAQGILFAPAGWALYEYALRQAIELIRIPVIELHFTPEYQLGIDPAQSIFHAVCRKTLVEAPETVFQTGIDQLLEIAD
ncbi:MAG: type II 3-dehydroquinate dehydratase [FCB group bacterium]|nr:type II 3-dehydroquinate dehydratase [FCB group bacterium]